MQRKLLVAALAFIALGMPRSSIGVAWPSAADQLGRPVAQLGILLAVFVTLYGTAAALSARAATRWRPDRVLIGATFGAAVGLLGVLAATSWLTALAAMAVVGFGGGFIDASVNTEVALHHGPRAMGMLHASYGVGATLGPLAVTLSLSQLGSWRPAFAGFALVQAVVVVGFFTTRSRWATPPPALDPSAPPPVVSARARNLAVAMFALLAAAETAGAQWGFSLLNIERGMSETAAGLAVAGYYGALTGSRLALGIIGHRVDPVLMLRVGTVVAACGAGLVWWGPTPVVGASGLVVLGLGIGPLFPLGMSLTPRRVGAEATPRVVGYQLVGANVGAAVYPAAMGVLVGWVGLESVGPALAAAAVALVVTSEALRRIPAQAAAGRQAAQGR